MKRLMKRLKSTVLWHRVKTDTDAIPSPWTMLVVDSFGTVIPAYYANGRWLCAQRNTPIEQVEFWAEMPVAPYLQTGS